MTATAIIGGSGFADLPGLKIARRETPATPYGAPSAALVFGRLCAREFMFLPRHGGGHAIPPHRINYRANIRALKDAGARQIIALAAVGGIAPGLKPPAIVIPHQLIDYTWGRAQTFFDGEDGGVEHIEFAEPYTESLRRKLLAAARAAGVETTDGAVYAVTQGPRLETAAEIDKLARDGADIVGMTAMPEAALARELGMDYAAIATVVNPAAGRGALIRMEDIARHLRASAGEALKILCRL